MEEVKEFKVGDYILKDDVYTSEGSARYRRMSDFCNDNKLVMKESTIQGIDEHPSPIEVYMISEPDPVPPPEEEPIVQPEPSNDAEKIAQLEKRLDDQTLLLADLIGGKV